MPGLTARLRGGIYHAVGSVAGQRIRKSLGTRDEAQAQELCAHYEARLWKRHSYGEEAVRTFDEAALSYMEAGGEKTYLPPIIRKLKARVLGSIKPGEIADMARALYPDGKAATRNRQAIVPARAVINHAAAKGWCPPIKIPNFPVERVRRRAVDRTWIDAFLARADKDMLAHLAAGVLFMYQTGTRVSEAARVLPEHVDLKARTIVLPTTKEEAWEVRHISRELVLRIANLPKSEGEPLFGYRSRFGIYRRMVAVCRRAGLTWVPPHQAGRHSFATTALAMGAGLKQVMTAAGWKSARMVLEIYDHADDAGRIVADMFDTNRAQPKSATARKPAPSRRRAAK